MLRIDNSHQLFVGGCVSAWFVIQTAAAEVEQLTLPAQVVFEATRHYGFIYDSLKSIKAIKRIVMAYPGHVRLVFRGKQRNDRMDARKLAKLLCLDEAPMAYIPSQDSSAGKNRLGHITKQGLAAVRKLLCEGDWQVIRRCPEMSRKFDKTCHGRQDRRKIALVATARHLSCVMFSMLKTDEVYRGAA